MKNQEFQSKLKDLRESKGLSQDELARLAGINLRTVQRIEKGETNPHGDTRRKILSILESYPDMDNAKQAENRSKKNFILKLLKSRDYVMVIYGFSIIGILIGKNVGILIFFFLMSSVIGFSCLVVLTMFLVYNIKLNGWKKEFKYLIVTIFSIVIYLLLHLSFVSYKFTQTTTINGVTTKIERNTITGKIDTTVYTRENFPVKD